jgi:putative lipoprotein
MTTLAIIALLVFGPGPQVDPQVRMKRASTITGTVSYQARIALPPGAVITVQLRDVSLQDAPAKLIAEIKVSPEGKQVPIPFSLPYTPANIIPTHTYAVSATIMSVGKMAFTSTQSYPVITRGAPSKVDIMVQPASAPTASATPLEGTEWTLTDLGGAPPVPGPANRRATITLISDGKKLVGTPGCNHMGGTYELPPDPAHPNNLKLDSGAMTMMACAEPLMKQEQAFVEALKSTSSYRIDGQILELRDGDRVLARFSAGPPPPIK